MASHKHIHKHIEDVSPSLDDRVIHILDLLPDALLMVDQENTIFYANATAEAMAGATRGAFLGKNIWQCPNTPRVINAPLYNTFFQATHTHTPLQVEYVSPLTHTWRHVHIAPTAEGAMVHFHETTLYTMLQDALFQSEQLRQAIADGVPADIAILTADGIVLEINKIPLENAQVQLEDVIGKPLTDAPWWAFSSAMQQRLRDAIAQAGKGEVVRFDARVYGKKVGERELEATITPHLDADNNVTYLLYTGFDVTERKRAEAELRFLAETIPQFVWVARADGLSEYHNQRWYDYTNTTPEQGFSDRWVQFVHPEDRQRALEAWYTSVQTGTPYEAEFRFRNGRTGEYRWFLARAMPFKDERGNIVKWFGTLTDIHDKKQTETRLRLSEARYQRLLDSNIIGLALGDIYGHIYEANEAFARMIDYTQEEIRAGLMRWDTITPPEYRYLDEKALKELQELGVCRPFEKEYQRKDGSRVPVIIGAARLAEADGKVISFIVDISERKELEKRKDEFVSLASHELKTPLTALKMLLYLLRKKSKQEEYQDVTRILSRMEAQVTTVTQLINDLLDVSKIQMGRFDYADEPIDLDTVIQEVVETLQQTTTTQTLRLHGAVHQCIVADKRRLAQVFTNIISNAIKYSPQADSVDIWVSASQNTAVIRVQDYGVGIPEELQSTVFERFNRGSYGASEKVFPGLGMGLYIAKEIVEHYGGTITVESAEGRGTTFTVSLPGVDWRACETASVTAQPHEGE